MTPKEKADELVNLMCNANQEDYCTDVLHAALKCALIAVDEIIKVLDAGRSVELYTYIQQRVFWIDVKKEMEEMK